jgi:hypothetical protein
MQLIGLAVIIHVVAQNAFLFFSGKGRRERISRNVTEASVSWVFAVKR